MIILTIIYFILIIGVLVFVHEGGHFITAKMFGIKVNEFALGMGPHIFKFKKGETEYSLRAFPIGGYCKMEGEDEESSDERAFGSKPAWQRIIVVVAGAVMNLILGFIIMLIITSTQKALPSTVVAKFDDNAVSCGENMLLEGDEIIKVDGQKVHTYTDVSFTLALNKKEFVPVTVIRNGEKVELPAVSFPYADENKSGQYIDFYVKAAEKNVGNVISQSFHQSNSIIRVVWVSFIKLFTGGASVNDMSGPVGMTQAVGEAAKQGLSSVLMLAAFITINLGIVNLLPLPALDGGRLVFLIFEAITRRKVPAKYEGIIHFVGLVLLMGLMLFITFNDIVRIIG